MFVFLVLQQSITTYLTRYIMAHWGRGVGWGRASLLSMKLLDRFKNSNG